MKKLSLFFTLCFVTASLFSVEISLGGYAGGVVRTQTASIKKGLPQFGLVFNVDIPHFGIQTSFGFDFWTQKALLLGETKVRKDIHTSETILITPYYPFHHKKFSFTIGPSIGFKFSQSNLRTTNTKEHLFYLVFGGELEMRYAATEHVAIFLNMGFFTDTGSVQTKYEIDGIAQLRKSFVWQSDFIYFVPKFGVVYSF